jgi:hypothetical protein
MITTIPRTVAVIHVILKLVIKVHVHVIQTRIVQRTASAFVIVPMILLFVTLKNSVFVTPIKSALDMIIVLVTQIITVPRKELVLVILMFVNINLKYASMH